LFVAGGLFLMSFLTAQSSWVALLPGFIVAGIGIGTVNPVLASSAVAVVPPSRSGMASGANNTFRQVGIATGIAALGAVFAHEMETKIAHALATSAAGGQAMATHGAALQTAFTSGQVRTVAQSLPPAQSAAVIDAYRSAFATSLDHLLLIGTVVAFLGAVCSYALVRQRDFVASHAPSPGGPGPSGDGAPPAADGAAAPAQTVGPNGPPADTEPRPARVSGGARADAVGRP